MVYHVRGVEYYVIHGREVKKEICDWPDGFYELDTDILICDLHLQSKCKMDCTFFLFFFLHHFDAKQIFSYILISG